MGHYFPRIKSAILPPPARDNMSGKNWDDVFSVVNIQSSADASLQHAYFLASKPGTLKPLIVSLHSWSNDFSQKDALAEMARKEGWNYIHPDFRGPNNTIDACLSKKVISDIDDAIQYAENNGNVDINKIFIVGASGGGYVTLGSYLKTSHKVKAFLSWVPISDLSAWFYESKNRSATYAHDILRCTSDGITFDQNKAKERSPMFWDLPLKPNGRLEIYAGIDDGYTGSVPIQHSIQFFNRIVEHYGYADSKVGQSDIIKLLSKGIERNSTASTIDDREVVYKRDTKLVSLVIFNGSHEMLPKYCFYRIKQIAESSTEEFSTAD
jgi:pimeloyl-ACP methyl ester carboxylesterase